MPKLKRLTYIATVTLAVSLWFMFIAWWLIDNEISARKTWYETGLKECYQVEVGEIDWSQATLPSGKHRSVGYYEKGFEDGRKMACAEQGRGCDELPASAHKEIEELQPANKQAPQPETSPTWSQEYFDAINARFDNEYNAKVILLGGLGSHHVQKSAYIEGGNSFLTPTDDWVSTSFTRAGAIWVNCREGYTVAACGVNYQILGDAIDPELGCYYEAQQMREDIEVKCVESH